MRLLELAPEDALTFGSLKNFTAGESHYQQATFPPPIMRFFSLGKEQGVKPLKIMGIFLRSKGEVFLPMPADCLKKRKQEEERIYVPKWDEELKMPFIKPFEEGELLNLEQARGFCSFSDFVDSYAKGESFSPRKVALFKEEERVGVKLNYNKRVAEEGFLYSRIYLRFMDSRLLLLVDGELQGPFLATVGGERKHAKVEPIEDKQLNFLNSTVSVEKDKLYKFYCTTHLFANLKEEVKINETLRFKVEWVSSLEPEWVSGFKKPFLYMLRPGTVLWLRALERGICKRLCQVYPEKEVIKKYDLPKRGWNSGLLLEV